MAHAHRLCSSFIVCKNNHYFSIAVSLSTCSLSPCVCSVLTSHALTHSLACIGFTLPNQHRSQFTTTVPMPSLTMTHHDMPSSKKHTVAYCTQQQPLTHLNVQTNAAFPINLRNAQATQPRLHLSTLIRSCRPSIDLASLRLR